MVEGRIITKEQFDDLCEFISTRREDIVMGMENFGMLESLLSVKDTAVATMF